MGNSNFQKEPADFTVDKELTGLENDPLIGYLHEKTDKIAEKTSPITQPGETQPPAPPPPSGTEFTAAPPDEPKKPKKPSRLANRSKAIVEIFDQIQEPLHDELYKMAYFNRQERADLLRIRRVFMNHSKPGETAVGTEYENALLDKVEEWDKYVKTLPLDEDDKKDWADAWKEILQGSDDEMGPGKAFMVTTFLIFAPKWIPLFKKLPKHVGKLFGIAPEEYLPERKFSFEDKT